MITREVIVDSNDQAEGYQLLKEFLKNKTKYTSKFIISLDEHLMNVDEMKATR